MKTKLLIACCLFVTTYVSAQNWNDLGPQGFSVGWSYDQVLEFDNQTPYVAYKDYGENESVVVKKYDGANWVQVGTGASTDDIDYFSFALKDGVPYVAFDDPNNGQRLTVRKYDGTNWINVGLAGISNSQIYEPSIAFDGDTLFVAYLDASDFLSVQKFDGTMWISEASNLTNAPVGYVKMKISNGNKYILYHEYENNSQLTRTLYFDGQVWSHLPDITSETSATGTKDLDVFNGIPFVLMLENTTSGTFFQLQSFNGTSWDLQGVNGITDSLVNYVSLTVEQGIPYVAYKEVTTSKLLVKKYNGVSWEYVGNLDRQSFHTDIRIDPVSFLPMVAFSDLENGEMTSVIILDDQASVEEGDEAHGFAVFPNPANHALNIPEFSEEVTIYSLSGEILFEQQSPSQVLDISSLASGIYIINVRIDGVSMSARFVKEMNY
jgi:hypothetical protein